MRILILSLLCFLLTGCPVAKAHDVPDEPVCVIDVCEEALCTVETPEGTVHIEKKPYHKEGMLIECPTLLAVPE